MQQKTYKLLNFVNNEYIIIITISFFMTDNIDINELDETEKKSVEQTTKFPGSDFSSLLF